MSELGKETHKRIEELHFGDVFTTPSTLPKEDQAKYVITCVGDETTIDAEGIPHFSGAKILCEDNGNESISLNGGHDIRDVGEVVDRWTLDKVLAAAKRNLLTVLEDNENLQSILNEYIDKAKIQTRKI